MKTPFDPVVRIGTRDIETLRDALRQEMVRVAGLALDGARLADRVRNECKLAETDVMLRTDSWVRVRQAQAERIVQQRTDAEAGLVRLREQAIAVYGKLRAAEKAASSYIERAEAEAQRKAQAEADDLASARRLLELGRGRKRAWQHDAPS